jgi:hypothetical protein
MSPGTRSNSRRLSVTNAASRLRLSRDQNVIGADGLTIAFEMRSDVSSLDRIVGVEGNDGRNARQEIVEASLFFLHGGKKRARRVPRPRYTPAKASPMNEAGPGATQFVSSLKSNLDTVVYPRRAARSSCGEYLTVSSGRIWTVRQRIRQSREKIQSTGAPVALYHAAVMIIDWGGARASVEQMSAGIGLAIGIGLSALLAPIAAIGAAVEKLRAAIEHGKAGRGNDFREHLDAALAFVRDAGAVGRGLKTSEALVFIEAAIDHGAREDLGAAAECAERALAVLEKTAPLPFLRH